MSFRTTVKLAVFLTLSNHAMANTPPPTEATKSSVLPPPFTRTEQREPCDSYTAERRPHFGDLHVHTAWSFDANSQDTRNKPADAYRFARGAAMGIQPYDENDKPTRTIKLDRPLDFTAVTDHSEFMGEMRMCTTEGLPGYWHPVCVAHRTIPQLSFLTFAALGMAHKTRWGFCGENNEVCFSQAADHMEGTFSATLKMPTIEAAIVTSPVLSATSGPPAPRPGQNLHHNVIFRNHLVPERALSWIETPSQIQLWDYLDEECIAGKPGCDAVVIPHNANISGGLMFETARITNKDVPTDPVTAEEAARRARWNTLFEVMQHKGSSECDSRLPTWSEDEYCNFEKLGYDRFGGKNTGQTRFSASGLAKPHCR